MAIFAFIACKGSYIFKEHAFKCAQAAIFPTKEDAKDVLTIVPPAAKLTPVSLATVALLGSINFALLSVSIQP